MYIKQELHHLHNIPLPVFALHFDSICVCNTPIIINQLFLNQVEQHHAIPQLIAWEKKKLMLWEDFFPFKKVAFGNEMLAAIKVPVVPIAKVAVSVAARKSGASSAPPITRRLRCRLPREREELRQARPSLRQKILWKQTSCSLAAGAASGYLSLSVSVGTGDPWQWTSWKTRTVSFANEFISTFDGLPL